MTDTPTPTSASGWKLVPVEPTIDMKQAGYIAWCDADKTQVYGEAIADRCYGAMLAAAPVATPTSADVIEEMREAQADAFAYAVWMVGNMDTAEDKAAWWADFRELWELAANRVTAMRKHGMTVGQGFAATGLRAALALHDLKPDNQGGA